MRTLPLLFFACIALTVPMRVSAQVIHEVSPLSSPDWVELYLTSGASAISLDGMMLVDGAGNTKKLEGTLAPDSYLVFEWSNKLNNKGDTVSLVKGSETIDVWDYTNCPLEGSETLGKQNGKLMRFKVATKAAQNSPEGTLCSAEPTPTPTVVQTPSPTPRATQAPPTQTPKPKATPKISPSSKVLSAEAKATMSPVPYTPPAKPTSPFLFLVPVGMGVTAYGVKELVKSMKSHI